MANFFTATAGARRNARRFQAGLMLNVVHAAQFTPGRDKRFVWLGCSIHLFMA